MRISGGEVKGRRIGLPRGCRIRPTADRVKESLFDILPPVGGRSFLDLFAGSGCVGMEALSRGARLTAFVEKDFRLTEAIRANLVLLGFSGRAEVVTADAQNGLGRLAGRGKRFDILFADPPYDEGYLRETLQWLEKEDILAEGGIIVIQHSVREAFDPSSLRTLVLTDQRRYGDTILSFIKKGEKE
ncbi:MAG: 16S rRNA (guanine(966)-N(2))-methyltransferase RsmD [Syntrophobacterales bacterium RBG_19FT_COMBO_59_10]|nr:MAG: 16S rRNA (guanine(966)-N(2))-methyltransferase RsmD [Syntrophobacterales bacterium RBG_19FT_COMBO_59_10]